MPVVAKTVNVVLRESGKIRQILACTGWKMIRITVDEGSYRDNYQSFMAPIAVLPSVPGAVAAGSAGTNVTNTPATSVAGIAGSVSRNSLNIYGGAEGYPLVGDATDELTLAENPDELMHIQPRVKAFRVAMTVFTKNDGLDVTVNIAEPYAAESITTISNVAAMIPTQNIESIDDGAGV